MIRIRARWEYCHALLKFFAAWGIYERFISEGKLLAKVDFWIVGQPKPAAEVDLSVFSQLSAVPGLLLLPQNRTEALLLEAVRAAGFTETLSGHQAVSFQQDAAGVSAEVTGPDGAIHTYRGQYLVGCDGAHSAVRTSLGWELQGKTYPSRVFLADIRIRDERDQLPWPRLAPAQGHVLAAARYEAEHWRIISTLAQNETEQAALQSPAIDRRVDQLFGTVLTSIFGPTFSRSIAAQALTFEVSASCLPEMPATSIALPEGKE